MISPLIIYVFIDKENKFSKNIDIVKEFFIKDSSITKDDFKITIYNTEKKQAVQLPLEEYICGVVAAEMPANFQLEALKAQAVAARTFVMSKVKNKCNKANGADICDSVHCQVYIEKDIKKEQWGKQQEENWNKIVQATNETKGIVLTYNGDLVLHPQFFATSSGKTESSEDVFSNLIPYLQPVNSPGEEIAPKFKTSKSVSYKEFVNVVNSHYGKNKMLNKNIKSQIKILSRTESGMVKEIQLGGIKIKGVDFRNIFNLSSANFTLDFKKDNITINCLGYGHGVGMSQWGANVMAKSGKDYTDILTHYYTGVDMYNIYN